MMALTDLTPLQSSIVEHGACYVPLSRRPDFHKYVADALRGRQQVKDTDLRHIVSSAINRTR